MATTKKTFIAFKNKLDVAVVVIIEPIANDTIVAAGGSVCIYSDLSQVSYKGKKSEETWKDDLLQVELASVHDNQIAVVFWTDVWADFADPPWPATRTGWWRRVLTAGKSVAATTKKTFIAFDNRSNEAVRAVFEPVPLEAIVVPGGSVCIESDLSVVTYEGKKSTGPWKDDLLQVELVRDDKQIGIVFHTSAGANFAEPPWDADPEA